MFIWKVVNTPPTPNFFDLFRRLFRIQLSPVVLYHYVGIDWKLIFVSFEYSQPAVIHWKSTKETWEQNVKFIQS